MALLAVQATRAGHLAAVDAALMLATATYVPVDSAYELQMADHLVRAGRSFVKPLRYEGGAVLPDFVLLDTDPHTCVEVYGIHGDADYDRRKQEKRAYYHANGIPLIEWDVGGPLPRLGAARA